MRDYDDETILLSRLRGGDPTAPSDLFDAFIERLRAALIHKMPTLPASLCHDDFAIDTLLKFGKNPHSYHAKRGMSLFNYLVQDALGDLFNALARELRRQKKMAEAVEHLFHSRNHYQTDTTAETVLRQMEAGDATGEDARPASAVPRPTAGTDLSGFLARCAPVLREPHDAVLLELLWREERRTEPYARAMGIAGRPREEQRRLVKQAKDRLKVAIKRIKDTQ